MSKRFDRKIRRLAKRYANLSPYEPLELLAVEAEIGELARPVLQHAYHRRGIRLGRMLVKRSINFAKDFHFLSDHLRALNIPHAYGGNAASVHNIRIVYLMDEMTKKSAFEWTAFGKHENVRAFQAVRAMGLPWSEASIRQTAAIRDVHIVLRKRGFKTKDVHRVVFVNNDKYRDMTNFTKAKHKISGRSCILIQAFEVRLDGVRVGYVFDGTLTRCFDNQKWVSDEHAPYGWRRCIGR